MKIYKYNGITYKRTRKDAAFRQLSNDQARMFFIVGCNVHPNHFHKGWHLASLPISLAKLKLYGITGVTVEAKYNYYKFYLEPELGRYPIIYVEVK